MTIRLALAAVALAVLALPPSAAPARPAARAAAGLVFLGGGDGLVRQARRPARIRGRVVVDFRGDRASGCAVAGSCDLAGRVEYVPARTGEFLLAEFGGSHAGAAAYLFLDGGRIVAQVERGGDRCADARAVDLGFALRFTEGSRLAFGPADGVDPVATRCAGPLLEDLRRALPHLEVTVRALRSGTDVLDLGGRRAFRGGGFTGTVRSSVAVRLREPSRRSSDTTKGGGARLPTGGIRFRLERVAGELETRYAGAADPAICAPLDACGLRGQIAWRPRPGALAAELRVFPERPAGREALRRGLGLEPGRPRRDVQATGAATLSLAGGVRATATRADGAATCRSSGPDGELTVSLQGVGRRVVVRLQADTSTGRDLMRTRCPGPTSADAGTGDGTLAESSVPLRAFGRRRVVLRLRAARPFDAGSFTGRTRGTVIVVLRRTRLLGGAR